MKKLFLTGALALTALFVSAQNFMVTADIDMEDFSTDSITDKTDLGFGYSINAVSYTHLTLPTKRIV